MQAQSHPEFYLSTYLAEPGPNSVLSSRHDQAVALWRRTGDSVELARIWELERLSGQKHHHWPAFTNARVQALLSGLLDREGLSLADIRCTWGTPGLPGYRPLSHPAGAERFPLHSLAHLFSGLLLDTTIFKEATIVGMAIDGGPDFVQERSSPDYWYAGCVSRTGRLEFLPIASPGPLYGAASAAFGREPGTLMALASACRSKIKIDAEDLASSINLLGGRTFPPAIALPFLRALVSEAEEQLSGRPLDSRFSRDDNIQSAVMSAIQECCEIVAIRNVTALCEHAQVRPQDSYLSVSGGFALNCPANSRLMDDLGFRGLLVPPCANDSGQALGLGLMGLLQAGAFRSADFRLGSAYYGNPVRDVAIALAEFEPWIEETSGFSPEQFVHDVCCSVVAWVDGEAELGPRALGHRSLLGDPRSAEVKNRLNEVKQRQWWRPVAPVVLDAHAARWFDQSRPSPYMLEVTQVFDHLAARVPAIVHLDGSARHQVLEQATNPRLYQALEAFRAATGVPMLCNTSLNDKGEPIVDTAAEALNFCVRKGIKVIYLEGRRVVLRTSAIGGLTAPADTRPRSCLDLFTGQEADRDALWNGWLERGYSDAAMFMLAVMPGLRKYLDPSAPERVNALAEQLQARGPKFGALVRQYGDLAGPGTSFSVHSELSMARLIEGG
jgi:carbamoyltransferase